jgi:hypothetical protein
MPCLRWAGTGLLLVLSGLAVLLVFGEGIDNRLGILTTSDLSYVKEYKQHGVPLQQLIARRYDIKAWNAKHTHELFWTLVECEARKIGRGNLNLLLAWEVGHYTSPDSSVQWRRIQLVPLTREAAELTPGLAPLGLSPEDYPRGGLLHAGALFGWARGQRLASHRPGCSDLGR